jgi:hypothetical protein
MWMHRQRGRRAVAGCVAGLWFTCGVLAQGVPAEVPPTPTTPTPTTPARPPQTRLVRPAPRAERVPAIRPFNPDTDLRTAIDAAAKQGAADNRRVLVIWGDNGSIWAEKIFNKLIGASVSHAVLYHYEVVWADVGDPTIGPINIALAQGLGASPPPETGRNSMPYFTILATTGPEASKAVVNRSSRGFEDPRKVRAGQPDYNHLKLEDFLLANKPEPISAAATVERAKAAAAQRGVPVLLYFDEVADGWCVRFREWAARPAVAAVLDKHLVTARVDLNRMDGAFEVYNGFGGDKATTSPWYVVLDPKGERVKADGVDEEFGFPTGAEIPRFTAFLRRVAPKISDAEEKLLEESLAPPAAAPPTAPAPPGPATGK